MISDYAPEQVLFDLSKKTIKVNEQVSQTIFQFAWKRAREKKEVFNLLTDNSNSF